MKPINPLLRAAGRLFNPWARRPVYLLFYVTQRCDAKCRHCFLWRDLNRPAANELTVADCDRLAASLGPMVQVTLTGGSPELRRDLPAIARVFHQRSHPLNLTLCCNGYHTDAIVADVTQILSDCPDQSLTVGLSLNGLGAAHDEVRGMPGLFERVVKTYEGLGRIRAQERRLQLVCAICVSEFNWDTAPATAAWAHDHLPIDLLKPILIRGRPRNQDALGARSVAAYVQLVRTEAERLRQRASSPLLGLVKLKEAVQREVIAALHSGAPPAFTCAAARETAVVHADGTVMACELREERLGNLREVGMDLTRIWRGVPCQAFRRRIREEQCVCYHHCFLTPALFRSPRFWPRLLRAGLRRCQPPS